MVQHFGIAEKGKLHALKGDHVSALRLYRQAMNQAQEAAAPEVFLRHYTQCALESLERMGAYDEVLDTCARAQAHYETHPPADDVARLDRASFLERAGVIHLRRGDREAARAHFEQAIAAARPLRVPLAESVAGWLRSNLHVTPDRLERELVRHRYWSVRADVVRKSLVPTEHRTEV